MVPAVRRLLVAAVFLLALAAPAEARAPSRLLVEATEFHFTLSRASVATGPAVVQLAIRGEDPHDLRLVRLDSHGRAAGRPAAIRETLPGAVGQWSGRLARGRYRLYCSLPGHDKAGMHAVLRVH
jgi:hypothetical protein